MSIDRSLMPTISDVCHQVIFAIARENHFLYLHRPLHHCPRIASVLHMVAQPHPALRTNYMLLDEYSE